MYEFTDVVRSTEAVPLPSEALSINGEYLEDLIPGYRTLYVSGREILDSELVSSEVGGADGARYQRKRYPSRTIVVGYQLIASDNREFREAYNKLNAVLDTEEARLVFRDEPDKYFIGTKQSGSKVPAGQNSITGEIEFFCSDPFKYALEEKIVTPTWNDGKNVVIDYQGTYRCFPVLEAYAESELGFVGYVNQDGKVLQAGDAQEADVVAKKASQRLIDDRFENFASDNWISNSAVVTSFTMSLGQTVQSGMMQAYEDDKGNLVIRPASYGSGQYWHGPGITKKIPADADGHVGAKNCTFSFHHVFEAENPQERGFVQFLMTTGTADGAKKNVAGICFAKIGSSNMTERAHIYVGGEYQRDITFDVRKGNAVTGAEAGRSEIMKFGGKFTFHIGENIYEFNHPELADTEVHEISIYMGKYGTSEEMSNNGVYSVRFISHSVDSWQDVPNKFGRGDVITACCQEGKIQVNGVEMPGLGALGNDWEEFFLTPGMNEIQCAYSSWAVPPRFLLKYREVYL